MKNLSALLLSILLTSQILLGQLPVKEWDYRYGGNNKDELRAVEHTADGGYILGGYSLSGITGDKTQDKWGQYDYWIVRVDSSGNKLWDKDFGGTKDDLFASLDVTSDGGFILGGGSWSPVSGDKTQGKQGEVDYWIVKTDISGNKQWDKRFGGTSLDYLTCIRQTDDGGYILGGDCFSEVSGDVSQVSRGGYDYWIVKTDANGSKQWDLRFGGNRSDNLRSIIQTSDGGYLFSGTSESDSSGEKTEENRGSSDFWIVKTDENGLKQWDAIYGGDSIDFCNAALETIDGGFLLGGYSYSESGADKSQNGRGNKDFWIVKINSSGIKEWDKTFGGIDEDVLTSMWQGNDGGFLIAGYSQSPSSGEKTQGGVTSTDNPYTPLDYWMVKIDENGNYLWDKRFGGSFFDLCFGAVENSDNSFTLGGTSASPADGDKSQDVHGYISGGDYWLVKTTVAGDISNAFVGDISPLDFVPGNIFDVPFTTSGEFNDGNTFYAILSGNQGSFDTYDTIGSVNATGDATISATVPPGILNGENYRLRILSSDPTTSNPASETAITIGAYSTVLSDSVYGGNDNEYMEDMLATTDGGYLFAGETYSDVTGDVSQSPRGENDFWILKTDAQGAKQWDARFGGTDAEQLSVIQQTFDGGYIIGGFSNSGKDGDKSQDNRGYYDYWIVKTDVNGSKQWDKRFGGSAYDQLYQVLQTSDGGYLLGGASQSDTDAGGGKSQDNIGNGNDYWIVKINSSGTKQWDKVFGGDSYDEMTDMLSTPDGGYLLFGQSSSSAGYDVSDASRGGKDFWLIKIDANGTKQWDKRYGGDASEYANKILQTSDGGYILSGSTTSNESGDVSQPGYGSDDLWVIKIDVAGNKQWDKRFGGSSRDVSGIVIETSNGGLLVGGISSSNTSGCKTQNSRGDDYWVVRLDSLREQLWDTRFGGVEAESLADILQTSDGNYLLGGWSDSPAGGDKSEDNYPSVSKTDFWVVKISEAVFTNSIFTNQITPLAYHAGDEASVPFTATGAYAAENNYTVQLSSASGNFSSPINIGTLNSKTSGTISAAIPITAQAGTHYRIRVVSSNPAVTGTDNGQDIMINAQCAVPSGSFTSNIKTTSAKVNWDMVPGAQTYSVRYRKTGTTSWTKTTTQLNYKKLSPLGPNTQYDWAVKSVCEAGTLSSDWCATQNFTTKPLRFENDEEEISFGVFPNPVADAATILFTLTQDSPVLLELLSVEGKLIMTIADENFEKGNQLIHLSRQSISSGIYLLQLTTAEGSRTEKLVFE